MIQISKEQAMYLHSQGCNLQMTRNKYFCFEDSISLRCLQEYNEKKEGKNNG